MSLWLDAPDRGQSPPDQRRDGLTVPAGVAVLAVGLALVIWQARFRVAEAGVSAWTLRTFRLRPASALGDNVIFLLHGRWVGFSLSIACTAALLVVPFFLLAGLLVLAGRVDRGRAVVALAVVSVVIVAVNQLRLMVITGSMLWWGFKTGYERSHILLGTLLSTVGVVGGIVLFVWMLVVRPERQTRERRS